MWTQAENNQVTYGLTWEKYEVTQVGLDFSDNKEILDWYSKRKTNIIRSKYLSEDQTN